jgi:hypothetical protein
LLNLFVDLFNVLGFRIVNLSLDEMTLVIIVRSIFKILGYHEIHKTTQKSTGREKFTSAEG